MDFNDDFMSAHLRETNANMEEIDMAGPQFSPANEGRFELTPPSIKKQFENEEKESFFKLFMEHNHVNLDIDSLKILLFDVYKDAKEDWYLKDTVSSKTVNISGAKK